MATRTSDRAHMHDDLRELARMASSPRAIPTAEPSSAPAFQTADSSGYVDLSAFSATDDAWVDRELARAKGGAVLSPGSMRPISLDALIEPDATASTSRGRTWIYSGLGLVGVAAVAMLAVTLSKHPPPSAAAAASGPPAATTPQTGVTLPVPAAAPEATQAATASLPIAPVVVAAPDPAPSSKKHPGAHHGAPAPPAAAPARVAAARPVPAPHPAVVPPPKSGGGGGGDSLMDAIRASVKK